jgi:hypothetical protein
MAIKEAAGKRLQAKHIAILNALLVNGRDEAGWRLAVKKKN